MTGALRYGPWALVTGASDGIGRALSQQLAAQGLNVVLVARRRDALATLASELSTLHGVQTSVLAVDLGDAVGVDVVEQQTRTLDIGLVVLAAGFGTTGTVLETSSADEMDLLAVNVAAVMRLAPLGWQTGVQERWCCSGRLSAGRGCRVRRTTLRRKPMCRASPRGCRASCDRSVSTCSPSRLVLSDPVSAPGRGWTSARRRARTQSPAARWLRWDAGAPSFRDCRASSSPRRCGRCPDGGGAQFSAG